MQDADDTLLLQVGSEGVMVTGNIINYKRCKYIGNALLEKNNFIKWRQMQPKITHHYGNNMVFTPSHEYKMLP